MAINPNNSQNVSLGKGKLGGYLLSAPAGTALPTDATSALDAAFVNLGYVSDDGITKSMETESDDIKDLNGDTVLSMITSRKETFNFNLMETKEESLKEIYGQDNVVVAADGSITVKSTSAELPHRVFVMEFVLSGGRAMRKVCPDAQITELGDENYSSGDAIKYEATITAYPDGSGVSTYTYIEKPTTAQKKEVKKGE